MSSEPRKSAFAGLKSSIKLDTTPVQSHEPAPQSNHNNTKRIGKRRDPNYQPVSTRIRKDIHRKIRVQLVQEDRDLADLLDELLSAWLRQKGVKL
jgi:hypothetical protein